MPPSAARQQAKAVPRLTIPLGGLLALVDMGSYGVVSFAD